MAFLDREERLRIRDVICTDVVALRKWSVVVDHLLSSEVDVIRIKDLLEKNSHAEVVLETLQFTNCDLGHVLEVLRGQGLNSLAENIKKGPQRQPESTWNHVWYKVGELPHDVSGRDFESVAIHKLLGEFHSNQSVDANIVCISGPAGCGKSTLARKYAFDHFDKYYSDVVWIEAHSVDSMQSSFEGLAAELKLPAESDTRRLVTSVYSFFNRRKCLFVFDGLKSMENFSQFRPQIMSPLFQTPYLLITSRSSGLAPDPRNEVCIVHQNELELVWKSNKPEGGLLRVLAYLDPDKITVPFLETMFKQTEVYGGDFETSLAFLKKHLAIVLSRPSVSVCMRPSVQEAVRSSLSKEAESSVLDTMQKAHQALIWKEGAEGALTRECTAHRLHVLRLDLKSISLANHFDRLRCDFENPREYSSALSIAQDGHTILKSRFGENENEATIFAKYFIACAHYNLKNYKEAIRIAKSLLPVARAVLDERRSFFDKLRNAYMLNFHSYGQSDLARLYLSQLQRALFRNPWLK